MAGLREKKKQEAREKILSAARDIFFTDGYENAAVEQIADKAGVGVGTVYNYFKTKADILISVVEEEVGLDDFEALPAGAALDLGIADAIFEFAWRALGKMMFLSKKIWRELLSAMFSSMKSDRKFAKGLASIDYGFIEKLKAMLCDFRARRLLPEGFDTDVAAMVVYGIIMTQAMLYIYEGETTVEQMKREIRRQIAFVFDGKSSGKEGTV